MAKRNFSLPGIQDLSKEQEDVRALPNEGRHLIIGGPGTGKSVMALLRARRLHIDNVDYIFLTYNKLLHQASKQLFGSELVCQQWQSWFNSVFKKLTNENVPKLPPNNGDNWQDVDWETVSEIIDKHSCKGNNFTSLVIDEGQDMPPNFYKALIRLGYENFFVVADQNQQISAGLNSARKDIEKELGIETNEVIELKQNYRNKYPIARIAREFYSGDPASPPPDLPPATMASSKKPLIFDYSGNQFSRLVERVLLTADRDPSKLIGVIVPNNHVREKYYNELKNSNKYLDNAKPSITTFKSGDRHDMDFGEGGIMVINAQACKGLEFDMVFIADVNEFRYSTIRDRECKSLFYVMVARAIDQIIMLKEHGKACPVEIILPKNPAILEWK